eukprot:CAMPEP_0171119068 /NCGR_PEP_ID=MMETSP0766_2-20121228/96274_1 /TAXON_ID=439317 /ORGANISM="Gambierdiscus australes, Strain CAWD 149" /LENGTH=33 /DNA_ID= /DNA_START= /DNA_END= /DNA_ORIENTATION=
MSQPDALCALCLCPKLSETGTLREMTGASSQLC